MSKPSVSHFGPPTAPNSTASAAFAFATVSGAIGVPSASIAAPPTSASSISKLSARRRSNQSMMRRTSRITSGPIPSPGSTSSFLLDAMSALPVAGAGSSPRPRGRHANSQGSAARRFAS